MNDGSETEDLIQTWAGEDGRSDTCTYHHARINSQHVISATPVAVAQQRRVRASRNTPP